MSRYRYHITPTVNLASILQFGLIPHIGERSLSLDEPVPAIFLFHEVDAIEDALMGWMEDCFDENQTLSLLAVDTQGLEEVSEKCAGFELTVRDRVSVERLFVISSNVGVEVDLPKAVHSKLNGRSKKSS